MPAVLGESLVCTGQLNVGTVSISIQGKRRQSMLLTIALERDWRLAIFQADGAGHILFRGMRGNAAKMPELGQSATTLGIRPRDIAPDENGVVGPGSGGLSVTPDDPSKLPDFARRAEFGGKSKLPVWSINEGDLGPAMQYRADPDKPTSHGYIEPAHEMQLEEFQAAIAGTQGKWTQAYPQPDASQ